MSATHLPGEELAVTVHGRAVPVDVGSEADADFRRTLLEVYVPRYGEEWESFLDRGVQSRAHRAGADVHVPHG